mgnify:CR=1 FL=1
MAGSLAIAAAVVAVAIVAVAVALVVDGVVFFISVELGYAASVRV